MNNLFIFDKQNIEYDTKLTASRIGSHSDSSYINIKIMNDPSYMKIMNDV